MKKSKVFSWLVLSFFVLQAVCPAALWANDDWAKVLKNAVGTVVGVATVNPNLGNTIATTNWSGAVGGAVNGLTRNWELTGSQEQRNYFMHNNGWQGEIGYGLYRIINTGAYTLGGLNKNNPDGYINLITNLSLDVHNSFNIGPWNFNPANVVAKTLNGVDFGNPTTQPLKQNALFRLQNVRLEEWIGFAGVAITAETWGKNTLAGVVAGAGINPALGNGWSFLTEHRFLSGQEDYRLAREGAGSTLLLGGTVDKLIKFATPIVKNSGTYQSIANRITNSGTYQAIANRITNSEISQAAANKISTGLSSQVDDVISATARAIANARPSGGLKFGAQAVNTAVESSIRAK